MARQYNRSSLRGIALFIAVLMVGIGLAALAQTTGAGHASGLPGGDSAPSQRNNVGAEGMGPGAPFFVPPVIYDPLGSGVGHVPVAVADVNGDGKPDLLVGNGDGSVAVLLGNGDGTFQSAVTYGSGSTQSQAVVVVDLNGDGKPDIVVGTSSGVGVLVGNGDGTFQPGVIYGTTLYVLWMAVADVNGDGKLDVVASATCSGGPHCTKDDSAVTVLLGRGDGTLSEPGQFYDAGGRQAQAVAVADLNGDGKLDLVVANQCTSQGCTKEFHGVVGVLLGNGDGTFQPVVEYSGGNHTSDVAIADVNGDGRPDILEVDDGSGAGVLLGNGDGTFQARVGYGTGGYTCCSLVLADVNGDGKLDMVVGNENSGTVGVLPGNGDGTFQAAVIQAESDPRRMAVADLNGDGRLDLVVGTSDGNIKPLVGVMMHVGDISTTTTVTSSLNPSIFAQSVTFTAKVTGASGTPQGTVLFYDGLMISLL